MGGFSPQEQQRQSLAQTMSNLRQVPAAQPYFDASQQAGQNVQAQLEAQPGVYGDVRAGLKTAGGFPQMQQASTGMSDAYRLFLKDMELATKYRPQPTPSDAPSGPGVIQGGLPMLTPESNAAGFQGLTDPSLADKYYSDTGTNALSALSKLLGQAGDYNLSTFKTGQATAEDAYKSMVDAEKQKQQSALDAYKLLTQQQTDQDKMEIERARLFKEFSDSGLTGETGGVDMPDVEARGLIESAKSEDPSLLKNTLASMDTKSRTRALKKLAEYKLSYADLQKIQKTYIADRIQRLVQAVQKIGPARMANPLSILDPEVSALQGEIKNTIQDLGKGLEGGKLSDKDFVRYAQNMGGSWNEYLTGAGQKKLDTDVKNIYSKFGIDKNMIEKRLMAEKIISGESPITTQQGQGDWEIVQ